MCTYVYRCVWVGGGGCLYLIFPTAVTVLPPVLRNPHSCSSNLQRLLELYIWGLEKWPWLGLWTQERQWEPDPDRSSFITGRTRLCSNTGAQDPASGSQLRESSQILCSNGPQRVWAFPALTCVAACVHGVDPLGKEPGESFIRTPALTQQVLPPADPPALQSMGSRPESWLRSRRQVQGWDLDFY